MVEQRRDYAVIYDLLSQGTERMNSMETDLQSITKIANSMQGFIKAIHLVSTIFFALLGLFSWILLEKNSNIKDNQVAITSLLISNTKIVAALENVIAENKAQQVWIDRTTEIILKEKRK